MPGKKEKDSPYSKFFKEESQEIFEKRELSEIELVLTRKKSRLQVPETKPAEQDELQKEWKALRKFYVSSKNGKLRGEFTPVHLYSGSQPANSLIHYPFWTSTHFNGRMDDAGAKCISLAKLISKGINELYPEKDQGKIIKTIAPKILDEAVRIVQPDGRHDFKKVFGKILSSITEKMDIKGSDKEAFETQISELQSKLPANGFLVPHSPDVTFKILGTVLGNAVSIGKNELLKRIKNVLGPLMDLIAVEMENDPQSSTPDHLKSSMGFANNFLDFEQLSSVIPESASEHISKERFERIKGLIKSLSEAKSVNSDATVIVRKDIIPSEFQWNEILSNSNIIKETTGKLCTRTIAAFQEKIDEFMAIIKALRIAGLEIKDQYVKEVHEDFFTAFDWNYFTAEEMALFPPVVLITDSGSLIKEELKDLSNMLQKGMPIKVLAVKQNESKESDPMDPSSLAVSHHNTFVLQSTSLNPEKLYKRMEEGIASFSPAFFHIKTAELNNSRNALIELSASVESRSFPEFLYNGQVGTAWGSRFDISDNPQPDQSWPKYDFTFYTEEDEELNLSIPFTYADFAVLHKTQSDNFREVDPSYWTDDLVLFSDFHSLPEKERYGKVPFIWMIDKEHALVKVATGWNIVASATEQLDYWYYLQDSGGVNSYHIQNALKLQEEEFKKKLDSEINRLKEEHQAALEDAKKQSAEEAMEHLTSALLDMDTDSIIQVASNETKQTDKPSGDEAAVKPADEVKMGLEESKEEEEKDDEEDIISEEPYIETPLCTNCNECIDINNRMFNYNAEKLAFIADPKAGTFEQLVEAAEKCPVGIIHPGKPLNPKEPGLDDLIKRASKFN